ncbi:MAG TPA: hypothetical protein VM328_00050 [Fimbriimonadaceae bacterium]|nr:hypothetical protein [Fimbriimonadaceae bacterium]
MVYQGTIPFGAPSQFRLQMAVDQEGVAYLTILSPFNEPVGNLHQLRVAMSDLESAAHGGKAVAENSKARCSLQPGHDETVEVAYEDPENFRKSISLVKKADLQELIASMPTTA